MNLFVSTFGDRAKNGRKTGVGWAIGSNNLTSWSQLTPSLCWVGAIFVLLTALATRNGQRRLQKRPAQQNRASRMAFEDIAMVMILVDLTGQQSGSVRNLFRGRYRCPHKGFNPARAVAVEARRSGHLPAQSLRSRGAAPALNPRGRPRHRRRRWAALGGARRRIREGVTSCDLYVTGSEGAHH